MAAFHSHPSAARGAAVPPVNQPPQTPYQRWNDKRTALFLNHLAVTCNVTEALSVSGMSSSSLYRRRRECPAFRAAWDEALDEGYCRLEAELLNRAINGETQEVVNRNGEVVTIRKKSDALGLALLKLHSVRVAAIRDLRGEDHERHAFEAKVRILTKLEQLARFRAEQAARGDPGPPGIIQDGAKPGHSSLRDAPRRGNPDERSSHRIASPEQGPASK